MSLHDCEKCWDIVCYCGWQYRDLPRDQRIALAAAVLGTTSEAIRDNLDVPLVHPKKLVP